MPKKSTSFEDTHPFITQRVESYGWLEIGQDENSAVKRVTQLTGAGLHVPKDVVDNLELDNKRKP